MYLHHLVDGVVGRIIIIGKSKPEAIPNKINRIACNSWSLSIGRSSLCIEKIDKYNKFKYFQIQRPLEKILFKPLKVCAHPICKAITCDV